MLGGAGTAACSAAAAEALATPTSATAIDVLLGLSWLRPYRRDSAVDRSPGLAQRKPRGRANAFSDSAEPPGSSLQSVLC
jgi:hypothetical protein